MTVMDYSSKEVRPESFTAMSDKIWFERRDLNHGIDGSVLALRGNLDIRTGEALRDLLSECLEDTIGCLIVDLSEVSFLDSTVLGTLVGFRRDAIQRELRVAIVSPKGPASQIFTMTSTERAFDIYSDVDSAIAAHG